MRRILYPLSAFVLVAFLLFARDARGEAPPSHSNPLTEIQAVLSRQAADWNRGDLDAFAVGYKNSPDILFIGHSIHRGYAGVLASYKQQYPDRARMGTLSFTDLQVQPLDERFATATGRYHLERTREGGGKADGYFLLVLEQTSAGWKIVRDDTTTENTTPEKTTTAPSAK